MTKWVYFFGAGKAEGDGSQRALLGGKGAGLAEMSRIGLPVPPGFTITTEVCTYYYGNKKTYPKTLDGHVKEAMARVEKIMGTKFGDKTAMPLLVSVRSGARDSMPGMMSHTGLSHCARGELSAPLRRIASELPTRREAPSICATRTLTCRTCAGSRPASRAPAGNG